MFFINKRKNEKHHFKNLDPKGTHEIARIFTEYNQVSIVIKCYTYKSGSREKKM